MGEKRISSSPTRQYGAGDISCGRRFVIFSASVTVVSMKGKLLLCLQLFPFLLGDFVDDRQYFYDIKAVPSRGRSFVLVRLKQCSCEVEAMFL